MFFYEFCGISKNTFSYRTPLVAASDKWKVLLSWRVLLSRLGFLVELELTSSERYFAY